MSSATIIAIAIAVAVVLGAIVFVTTARRSDVRGAGACRARRAADEAARRARRRAEGAATAAAAGEPSQPGTAVAVLTAEEAERRRPGPPTHAGARPPAAPAPWSRPTPRRSASAAASSSTARRDTDGHEHRGVRRRRLRRLPVADRDRRLRPGRRRRQARRDQGARANAGFFYAPSARTWLTEYPGEALPKAEAVYDPAIYEGMRDGLVALYQKCPHLGCRVPPLQLQPLVRVPVPRSQYNQVGEKKGVRRRAGMDRFAISVDGASNVSVDTGTVYQARRSARTPPARKPKGPHCITGAGGEHHAGPRHANCSPSRR